MQKYREQNAQNIQSKSYIKIHKDGNEFHCKS